MVQAYNNVDGILYIDGVSAKELTEKFGTPLYVISESKIRDNYRRLSTALKRNYEKIRVLYSCKANSNLSVLRILLKEGAGIDAVSPGEVFLALKVGFPANKILYTGTSVKDDELKFLLETDVMINVDSISQLQRLLQRRVPQLLSVRINPELGAGHHEHVITAGKNSKFGVWEETAVKAFDVAKIAGVKHFGIHMHIGSGILDINSFSLAVEKLLNITWHIHESVGIDFKFIDLGGGLGVPYRPEEKEIDLDRFSRTLGSLFKEKMVEYDLGEPELWVEPGRYIVADAGILLTRVNTLKHTPFKKFAGIDAGFNTLIRPAMYGSYHPIIVANKLDHARTEKYDVAGPLCESGDILAKDRQFPTLSEGDLLAILNAGAYGFSMSSQYNARPRSAEILANKGRYYVIRERETLPDLLRGQKIAGWLED